MSLLVVIWSMVSSVGLLLGVIHLMIWLRDRRRGTFLLAAIMAMGAGLLALVELALMTRTSTADYQRLLWWANVLIFAILVPMTWFVYVHLGTARRWLALTITAAWVLGLLINLLMPGNLTFSSIEALRTETTFWGETFVMAEGVANPAKFVADFASLLIMIYVADASARAYRRGQRRTALTVGGSILFFIVVAGIHTPLVDAGIVATPFMISFSFIAISTAMTVELVDEVTRAAAYGRELAAWEKKWRTLLNDIQLAVVGLDRDGRINYVNPFFRTLTGFSEAELLKRSAASLTSSAQVAEFERWLAEVPDGGPRGSIQYPVETVSGEYRQLVWSLVPLRNGSGEFDGILSIGEDITEQLQARAELDRNRQELEHLTRAIILGELGSTLAHELNQPLAAILANAQAAQRLLASEPPDLDEVREILADIVADDRRAGEVIDRMRSMLRRGKVKNEKFDLNAAIEEVLGLIEGERKKREVQIEFAPTPEPIEVWGGRIEIQQVVMNLVLNGSQAVADRQPWNRKIRIETSRANGMATIAVEDSGPGISDDIAPTIFKPFFTTKDSGLGMGLAISRRIVEAHGGVIEQAKGTLTGARFEVALPLSLPQDVAVNA